MIDLLLHLSVALAGGVVYSLAMLGFLVAAERLCRPRPPVVKHRLAGRGFDVVPRTSRWDDGGDEWTYRRN